MNGVKYTLIWGKGLLMWHRWTTRSIPASHVTREVYLRDVSVDLARYRDSWLWQVRGNLRHTHLLP